MKFERNALSTTKKAFKKKKVKTNVPISQTSSECLKVTIQTYRMENKELKMKLGNFKRIYQKHLCQLIILENNRKNFTLREVILGRAAKISAVFSK